MNPTLTAQKSNIARRFSSAASSYDAHAAVHVEIAKDLLSRLSISNPKNVLDIGAGTGVLTQQIHQQFPSATISAQDLCEDLLKVNQAVNENLEVHCGDFCDMDLLQSYDLIVSSAALHWMRDSELAASKIRKALRPEGQIALAIMTSNTFPELSEARNQTSGKEGRTQLKDVNFWCEVFPECKSEVKSYRSKFNSAESFLRVLHDMGVTASNAEAPSLTKGELENLCAHYNQNFKDGDKVFATYEVLHLWLV